MLTIFTQQKYPMLLVSASCLLLSGCGGVFGSVNQNSGNYNNWVADYSTRGTQTGATPLAAQPTPVVNSYQTAPLVSPVGQPLTSSQPAQPLAAQAPVVVSPLQSEVIVEPISSVEPGSAVVSPVAVQPVVTAQPVVAPVAASPQPVASLPPVNKGTATSAKGNWLWPVDGGKLFRAYSPGSTGSKGALISGAIGAPVRAANKGEVVYVGRDLPGLGNLIIISHAGNIASGYGHVGSIAVKEGDKVKQGQAIAKLEGVNIKEPVIHFEIRQNNQATNPISYLQPK